VVVSSMFETSGGVAAGLALAASLDELPYACGLGAPVLDIVADPLLPVDGVLAVRRPVPDPALLAAYGVEE
jgi:O-succinylbenzoate synthase